MSDHSDRDRAEAPRGNGAHGPSPSHNTEIGEGIRRWRQPSEWAGRDHRPGFYSITGEFIEMPPRGEGKPNRPQGGD